MIFRESNAGKVAPFWDIKSLNKQEQLKIDIESLWKYREAIDSGASSTDALAVSMSKASDKAKQFAITKEITRKNVNEFRRSEESAIGTTKGFAGSLKNLGAVAKTVGMAIANLGATMLASLLVNHAVEQIDKYIRANEIAVETAKDLADEWKKTGDSLESNKRTLDDISSEYAKLSQGVDALGRNVSLTADEYARYNSIVNQVADMFPEMVRGYTKEGNAIIKVTGTVNDLTEAYKRSKEAADQAIITRSEDAFKGFKSYISPVEWYGTDAKKQKASFLAQLKGLERYVSGGESALPGNVWEKFLVYEFSGTGSAAQVSKELGITVNSIKDLVDNYKKFAAYRATLEADINAMLSPVKLATLTNIESTDTYERLSDDAKTIVSTIVYAMSSEFYSQFDSSLDVGTWFQEKVVSELQGVDFSGAINAKSLFDADKLSLGEYQKAFDAFKKKIEGFVPEVQDALIETFSPNTDNLVSNIVEKLIDGWDKIKTLTADQLQIGADLDIAGKITWDSFYQKIVESQTAAAQSIDALSGSIKPLNDMYGVLNDAITEQAESGAMTYETYTKLIAANKDFADAVSFVDGKLQINADKAYDVADAYTKLKQAEVEAAAAAKQLEIDAVTKSLEELNAQIEAMDELGYQNNLYDSLLDQRDALEGQRDELEGQLRQYQSITAEIEAMYGAYVRFKKAQSTPNQGSVYDSGAGEMKETLKGGIKSKALNTDEVKAAIDFFVGEGDESQAGLKKRSKQAQKIADRYFTEKEPLRGLHNFQKDLLNKKKMGELSGSITKDKNGTLQIAEGVTAQDIADQLGMSLEAVRAMFDKWKEYDADADWDSLYDKLYPEPPEEAEKPTTPVDKAVEDLESATTTYEEKAAEAAERIEKANQLVEDALNGEPTQPTPTGGTPPQSSVENRKSEGLETPSTTVPTASGAFAPRTISILLQIAEGEIERITAEINGITGEATVTANDDDVNTAIEQLGINLGSLPTGTVTITLSDSDGAIDTVNSVEDALTAINNGASATVSITLPPETTQEQLQTLNNYLAFLPPEVLSKIEVDYSNVSVAVDNANTELGKLDNPTSTVSVDTGTSITDIQSVKDELDKIEDKKPVIDPDTKYVAGDVSKVNEELDKIEDKSVEILADASSIPNTVQTAKTEIDKLEDKTITITTVYESGGGGGGHGAFTGDTGQTGTFGSGSTSGSGGGRKKSTTSTESKPVDLINVDNIEEAQVQLNIFQVIWQKILSLFGQNAPIVDTVISPSAQAEITNAQGGLDGIASTEIPDKTISIDDTDARADVKEFEERADDTVEKKINVTYTGETGKFAKGTKNAPKGVVLVDEEGAELIEHTDGTYEIGTNQGPRFTVVDKGAVIHDADETKRILRKGVSPTSVRGDRFASGTLPPVSSGSGKKNTSSSKKNTAKKVNWKKYVDKLFDWIEVRLERLQTITKQWMREIERAIGYVEKNKAIDEAIKSQQEQIDALTQAYDRYMEQAEQIRKKTKLKDSTIEKIQNGTIDIASYSKKDQERIKAYMEWWEKAQAVKDELEDLKDEQQKLAQQKLDNIIRYYDNLRDRIEQTKEAAQSAIDLKVAQGREVTEADYKPLIESQEQAIETLREQLAVVSAEFNKQVAEGTLVEGSDAWYEYVKQITELDVAIVNAKIDLEELQDAANSIVVTNLTSLLRALQAVQNNIEHELSLIEAQGRIVDTNTYKQLIANGMEQIANLEQQNAALRAQQEGLDVLSDKYQEIQEQIDGNLDTINSIKVSQEQWNDAMLDLRIDELTRLRDELDKANDQYQRSLDLQKAIEDLERAKSQRTIRIFKDDKFVYEANTQEVAEKQRALDEKLHNETMAKFDETIEAIEDMKATSNVYAALGLTPTSLKELYPNATIEELITAVKVAAEVGMGLTDLAQAGSNAVGAYVTNSNNTNSNNVTFGAHSIIINTVGDADEIFDKFTQRIQTEMGNIMLQDNYGKNG